MHFLQNWQAADNADYDAAALYDLAVRPPDDSTAARVRISVVVTTKGGKTHTDAQPGLLAPDGVDYVYRLVDRYLNRYSTLWLTTHDDPRATRRVLIDADRIESIAVVAEVVDDKTDEEIRRTKFVTHSGS
jgi:hypothetical protein